MNKSIQKSKIEKLVMTKIKKQETEMRPHYYYSILTILGVLFVVLTGIVIVYSMSVVSLWLRIQDAPGPAYGAKQNLSNMIRDFPWWALILGFILLIITIYVIRKIGDLYKIRIIYLVAAIVALSVSLGAILSYTALPDLFYDHSSRSGQMMNSNQDNRGSGRMRSQQVK